MKEKRSYGTTEAQHKLQLHEYSKENETQQMIGS